MPTERFGCSIFPPSYEELTASTTNEDAARFQDFFPDELVNIINMFEEMPEGFHKISHLNYLIRRRNGHKNPLYPDAAAVTFPIEVGYIEFMESAFTGKVLRDGVNRLILHEKTHMLWAFVFSESIKNDWITLGGWYQDSNLSDAWMTTQDTEFVSAYAHGVNPDEDMAESVAAYICEPEKLMSRANSKYEFIRDRIMHGTRYMSHIREDLTFEVLNLYPDYDYPGKIKSLDLKVEGKPEEDKLVTVDITLNHIDGVEDGASGGWVRLASPLFMTVEGIPMRHNADIGFSPVDGDPWHLRGEVVISKYSKTGYWTPGDIVLSDQVGNSRFAGNNDYVWNMYVNNPLEDIEMPKYISGSLEYNLTDTIVEGHKAQWLEVSYKLTDNIGIRSTRFNLYHSHAGGQFGGDAVYDENTHIAKGGTLITEFFRTGNYYVSAIDFGDYADNSMSVEFSESPKDEPIKYIFVETANPDTEAPEIDLNRITVYAEPVNKVTPDGETLVTITYYARDDKSGLNGVGLALLDPQGLLHPIEYSGVIHRNSGTTYFDGDPTVWEKYTAHAVLPQGSAPGIWGLAEMSISDKAFNGKIYNFVETLIFEPDDSQEGYLLFAEMTDEEKLNLDLSALAEDTRGYSFVYRIVNEDTGQEISGIISLDEGAQNAQARRRTSSIGNIIDVSSLSDGKLVVIVHIKDADDKVVAVRSKTLMKGHVSGNGDANSNGVVDSSDVVEVVNALMGKTSINYDESNADANGDGIVNAADIIVIVNKITQVE